MKKEKQYIISWSWRWTTVIKSQDDAANVGIKTKYRLLCCTIGLLGWIPSILFKTDWKIHNHFLRLTASCFCYVAFYLLVLMIFHCILLRMNSKGKLDRFIDLSDK